jgi:serine/threonine protein kinase/tetratricopeptide (TPR) repeat protein
MEQFGRYSLIRRIGTGGMAEVFLARTAVAQGLAKTLVIKKIHPAFNRSRQFVSMFVDEAKIALGLNHPNIVQVFDFGAVGDTYFLAMEHVDGLDVLRLLQELIAQRQRLPYGLAAYIIQQAARGLDYAHRKADDHGDPLGIVHRDISPQNLLLSWDGAVKIVDFGIARARDIHEEEGVIKGKFAYMSPEQARGEPVDCRSDVFSAGIVLYELTTARPLFPGRSKDALELVRAGAVQPPRDFAPDLPPTLERIILKALAFHPADRYTCARELHADLGRYQLEWAQTTGELVDAGTLSAFLAQLVPSERRRAPLRTPRPTDPAAPSATGPAPSAVGSEVPGSLGSLGDDVPQLPVAGTPPRAEIRERKYVYVIDAVVRGGVGPAAQKAIGEFLAVVPDIAYKHDAIVGHPAEAGADDATRADDTLRFVIGLPAAGEDDAARAIRLARALIDALGGLATEATPGLGLGVGIQRGTATVGRRGKEIQHELDEATGDFAARLARTAAAGEVLVGGRVHRATRGDWGFDTVPSIDLPDTDPATAPDDDTEPGMRRARVYRLAGPIGRPHRRAVGARADALVGRDLEIKALRDAYRDCLVGRRKRQILIVGDTGVGKRSLVHAFLDGIPVGEALVLRTTTRVGTKMTPYGVVADLARTMLGLPDGAPPSEVQRRLAFALTQFYPGEEDSREARGALQMVGLLLGIRPGTEGGTPVQIDAEERRQRMVQIVLRIEQRLQSDKPLILVGEDIHWSDQETIELFTRLLKVPTARPILGIVTARPESHLLKAAREAGAEIIQLEELGPDPRRQLIRDRFAPGQDVTELVDQIAARAGGNPFFIHEMLDALSDRGIVVADPDDGEYPGLLRWVTRDVPVEVPSSIQDLLATRFDRLPPSEKETLLHAAVLGRLVTPDAVAALLGRAAGADLDALVRRGLMAPVDTRYRFKNDMTMTVAYGLVASEDRTRLHRLAAERIASSASYRPGQDDGVIARHLELAGDDGAAADRYLRAAGHAVEIGGNSDAFRQLTRALKLLAATDHERRFAARRQREEILRRLARRPQQLRELHALRREAEAIGDPGKLATAHAALAQFYIDVGKASSAQRAAAPALEFARQAGDRLGEAEALRLGSAIARLVGNNDESLRLGAAALAIVGETPGDRPGLLTRATLVNNQGTTLWTMGRLEEAIEAYAEALVIYRALGLPRLEARALNNMGIVFAALGEFEEALAHYKSALKLDQALGDRAGIVYKLGNIGQCYSDLGDVDRAESYLSKALKLAEQTSDPSSEADAAVSLGQARLQRNDPESALELFERGLRLARDNRERYQEIRALTYVALAQLDAGMPAETALVLARHATELARAMPMMVGIIYGMSIQGLALSRLGRHADAIAITAEAVRMQEAQARPEGAEYVLHWHARVLAAAGRQQDALAAQRRARGEIEAKAARLHDAQLKRIYLESRIARAIAR